MSIIRESFGDLNAKDCMEHPLFLKWVLLEDAHMAFLEYLKKNYKVEYTDDSSRSTRGAFYTIYDNSKTIYYRESKDKDSQLEFLLLEDQCLKDITEDIYGAFIWHYSSKNHKEWAQTTLDKLIEQRNYKEITEPYLKNIDDPVVIKHVVTKHCV